MCGNDDDDGVPVCACVVIVCLRYVSAVYYNIFRRVSLMDGRVIWIKKNQGSVFFAKSTVTNKVNYMAITDLIRICDIDMAYGYHVFSGKTCYEHEF